jgi:glycosyltransferase involved in cell wall biosynthesis
VIIEPTIEKVMSKLFAKTNKPTVSIGMFVHNGSSCIRNAIESILNQSFKDFELIISDNASTDETEKICSEFANKDFRIRYIRQKKNIGASANALFVLDQAIGEYYMWAAHDDVKSLDFLELNLKFLQDNLDYVASTSPVSYKDGLPDPIGMGDKALDQNNYEDRFLACLSTWTGCGRFYSLMRLKAILGCKTIREESYLGSDIAFIIELVEKGKFNRIEEGYVLLGRAGFSGSGNIYKVYRSSLLFWIIPFYAFSLNIWRLSFLFSFKSKILIAYIILKINLISFFHQIKTELKLLLTKKI